MESNNKKSKGASLIPIAIIFVVMGILMFESTKWLKYSSLILGIILLVISIVIMLKDGIDDKGK